MLRRLLVAAAIVFAAAQPRAAAAEEGPFNSYTIMIGIECDACGLSCNCYTAPPIIIK